MHQRLNLAELVPRHTDQNTEDPFETHEHDALAFQREILLQMSSASSWISMMGSELLSMVDSRLRQIRRDVHMPFGGVGVYLCGVLRQLAPVRATEVYRLGRRQLASDLRTMHPWKTLAYHPWVEVVKQRNNKFSTFLTKLGDGEDLAPEGDDCITFRDAPRSCSKVPQRHQDLV